MPKRVRDFAPSHLVSIIQPALQPDRPPEVSVDNHLRLAVHDISRHDDFGVLPEREHVEQLLEFVDDWQPDGGRLLVHCYAGVSRSTACALLTRVAKGGDVEESAAELRRVAPYAQPNRRLVQVGDEVLGLRGRLVRAVEQLGPTTHFLDREGLAALGV